jgi:hypothetical protein
MTRFEDYHKARTEAQSLADRCKLPVAIRKAREFGRDGFNVSFASRNDSDFDRAEIVNPGEPRTEVKP